MAWFIWYLMQRNSKKDERVNEMHREVVEIINEIKNEMKEMSKEQQKDFINVINMMHTALTNNTIALNEMKNALKNEKILKNGER